MKTTKTLVLAALFVAGLTFTSCKKSYHCECTYAGTTAKGGSAKLSKKDADAAKKSCEDSSVSGMECKWITE